MREFNGSAESAIRQPSYQPHVAATWSRQAFLFLVTTTGVKDKAATTVVRISSLVPSRVCDDPRTPSLTKRSHYLSSQ
jgi:hypothetical protein